MFMLDPIYLLTHGEADLGGKCPPYSQRDTEFPCKGYEALLSSLSRALA